MKNATKFIFQQLKQSFREKYRFKFYFEKRSYIKNYFSIYLLMNSFFIRILSRILFQFLKRNVFSIKVVHNSGLVIKFPYHYYFNNIEDLFLLYSNYYFTEYKKFFGEELQIKKGTTIIDIGAHIGTFSLPISYEYKSRVFSFEPNISNYQYLIDNIQINLLNDRISTYNVAISKENNYVEFTEGDTSTRGALTHNKFHKSASNGTTYKVKTVSLNDVVNEEQIKTVDILKIDCEGAEYEIIYNLNDNIFSMTKLIFVEIHPLIENRDPKRLIKFIKSKGFIGKYNTLQNGCYECIFKKNE